MRTAEYSGRLFISSDSWNLRMAFFIRRKRSWDQLMAPATGGWFRGSGGFASSFSKSSRMAATSTPYWVRMDMFICLRWSRMAARHLWTWTRWRNSKVPWAERSWVKDLSINSSAALSMVAVLTRNRW